jgi:hypothetical protein
MHPLLCRGRKCPGRDIIKYRRAKGEIVWYHIDVTETAASSCRQNQLLRYGDTVQGSLSEAEEQAWNFVGQQGDLILVDLWANESSSLDAFLTLSDDQGDTLATDDDGGYGLNARIGPFALPADGEYTVTTSSYSGSGGYILQLVNLRSVPAIQRGKPLVGMLGSAHPADFFLLIPGQDDSLLRLRVDDDEVYGDPVLSLSGLNGYITDTEYHSEGVIDPIIPMPGEVYAIAVTWNPSEQGGPYTLSLEKSDIKLLQSGVPQTGTLDYDQPEQAHYFRGEAGQQVRITAALTTGNIFLAIEVDNYNADLYLFSGGGSVASEVSGLIELPADDLYVVWVTDASGSGDSGSYTLTLEVLP